MPQPSCGFDLCDAEHAVSHLECRRAPHRGLHGHRRCAPHHQTAKSGGCLAWDHKEFHALVPARHHHQPRPAQFHPRHGPITRHDRVQVQLSLGRRPVDSDVNDFPERSVKHADEFRQFIRHRGGVRPPCSVDIGTQLPGEREPRWARQTSRPRQSVHGDDGTSARGCGPGRSEKTSAPAGSIGCTGTGMGSCVSECEKSSDDSIKVSLRGAGLPHT